MNKTNQIVDTGRIRRILDAIPQMVFWKDTESIYLGCNLAFAKFVGLPATENIIGMSDFQLPWQPGDAERFRAADQTVIQQDSREYISCETSSAADGQIIHWEIRKTAIHDEAGKIIGVIGTYTDATENTRLQERLAHTLDFENRIISLTHRFVHASGSKLAAEIDSALGELADYLRVDRAYLSIYDSVHNQEIVRHEWCDTNIPRARVDAEQVSFAGFTWWNSLTLKQEGICFSRVDEIPQDAVAEKEYYLAHGIKSNLEIAITAEGRIIAFLGFETLLSERAWTEDDIQLLNIFGEILGGALQREAIQQKFDRRIQLDEAMVDISTSFLNATPEQIDGVIENSLATISQIIEADQAYVYHYSPQDDLIQISHEWTMPGIPSKRGNTPEGKYHTYPWWTELDQKEKIVMFSSLQELPDYAVREREFYLKAKIHSNIDLRLTIGNEYIGSLGFNSYQREIHWELESVKPLQLLAELVSGGLNRKKTEKKMQRQGNLELLLLELSTKFISLDTENIDQAILETLGLLGAAMEIDRCYYDHYDSETNEEVSAFEWINPSEADRPWHDYDIKLDEFPFWNENKMKEEEIIFNSLDELPPEASKERAYQERVGVKSFLEINLIADGVLQGFLGMETTRQARDWQEEDLRITRIAGKIISSAIARKKIERRLQRRQKGEALQMELYTLLYSSTAADYDGVVEEALRVCAEFFGAERAYIYGIHPVSKDYLALYSWHVESLTAKQRAIPLLSARDYIWWDEMCHNHQPICFSHYDDLPEHASLEKKYYEKVGMVSNLDLNFSFGSFSEAYIGFASYSDVIRWDKEDIPLLRIFAEIFGNALTRRETEDALTASNDRLIDAQEIGHIGIWEIDEVSKTTFWSDEVYRIFGYRPGSVTPGLKTLRRNFSHDSFGRLENFIQQTINALGRSELDIQCTNRKGELRYLYFTGKIVKNNKKRGRKLRGTVQDITDRKLVEEQLHYISYHDILTGLYNRAYFEQKIKEFDQEKFLPLAIISGDVNGLKLINDTFGHQQGDLLLVTMADVLKRTCRADDVACRWGGDEFCILLPNTSAEAAEILASRIKNECDKAKRLPYPLSISLGISARADVNYSLKDLLKEVEDKMYQNKLLESSSARSSVIISLQETLAGKTYETEEHSRRLQEYARPLGEAINLNSNEMNNLMVLATLHDIGKIAVPEDILMKPGKLTAEEWEIIKKHPETGFRIAQATPELAKIADAILSHHERWDGKGYPQGLAAKNIPLISRVITLADTFDVMVHGRPYKESASWETALLEIERCAGSQFDPELAEIFCQLMRKKMREEAPA